MEFLKNSLSNNSCLPLLPGDLFFSYWTEHSSTGHPSRKIAYVFKNPKNAGMVRTIPFQAKSYLFSPLEMFMNSASGKINNNLSTPPPSSPINEFSVSCRIICGKIIY
jgi:hypothetical protein